MRKILLMCAASIALAGCVTAKDAADKVAEVQNSAKMICGFVPTLATVTALFSTDIGRSVGEWGAVICNAVTTNPLADGPGPANYKPVVNGVTIKGKFVR